jgi:o-succinylbenzoate synthase
VIVSIKSLEARFRAPFVSASGSVTRRELLLLRLEDPAGRVGLGEAAPLEHYDGASLDDVHAALEDCRPALERASGEDRAAVLAECERFAVLPHALAAIDIALWDLSGRRENQPVWRLLGADRPEPVEVNYTISAADRAGAAGEADTAARARFRCVKVKVGLGDDAGRVAAVRAAAGPDLAIRLDANGAWSVAEAIAALRALEPAGIELCEEPVGGLDEVVELASATSVPIAIDETAARPGALERRACEAVCLKLTRCGGISGLLEAAAKARRAGYGVYLASALDGPLGIAAALHAAQAIHPERPCGLATLQLFADRPDPLQPRGGLMSVPAGPGLGDGLGAWYGYSSPT